MAADSPPPHFSRTLHQRYGLFTLGVVVFIALAALLERLGWPRVWVGSLFLFATVAVYACIGLLSRTVDEVEYYVAGRSVPAMYNGMATAADWMSAASFIGTAGVLYLQGFAGLAYILGWTGGYCLVALLLAPYLRRFGRYTIPEFLGAREKVLRDDAAERAVRARWQERADAAQAKLRDVPSAMAEDARQSAERVASLRGEDAPLARIQQAEREHSRLPRSEAQAHALYERERDRSRTQAKELAGMPPQALPYAAGDPSGDAAARHAYDSARANFLALVLCLL